MPAAALILRGGYFTNSRHRWWSFYPADRDRVNHPRAPLSAFHRPATRAVSKDPSFLDLATEITTVGPIERGGY